MAGLGEQIGSAFERGGQIGSDAALKSHFGQDKENTRKEEKEQLAKAKAFRENMKTVADFASIWQFKQGEIKDLDDPKVKNRIKNELQLIFSDLSEGGKVGPRAKAMINVLADQEMTEARSRAAAFISSAGQGKFNLRTAINIANLGKPGDLKAYMDGTVGAVGRDAKARKDTALAKKADAETKKIELLTGLAERQLKSGGAGKSPGGALALLDPGASRAQSAARGQDRLSPSGVVETAIARGKGGVLAENRKPLTVDELQFLGLPGDRVVNRIQLDAENIRVPTVIERKELRTRESQLRQVLRITSGIVKQIENKPERVGLPSFIAGMAKTIERTITGLANLIPGVENFVAPAGVRDSLGKVFANIDATARFSAEIRASLVDLTVRAGALAGQTARGFSDKDFDRFAQRISAGAANDQIMVGVLRSFAIAEANAFDIFFKSFAGQGSRRFIGLPGTDGKLPFRDLSDKALIDGVFGPLLNLRQLDQLEAEISRRLGSGNGRN